MLLEKLKKIFGVETLDSKLERLDVLKSELDSINANIHNLASEYTKRVIMRDQVMKSGVDQEAITSINTRFSKYEENHLESIFKARKDQIRAKEAIKAIEKSSDVHNHIMNRETIKKAILNGSIDVREYMDIMKSEKGKKKFDYVMGEFASGKLKDSNGKTVTSRKQAIAIAYSESGMEKSNEKKAYKDNAKNKELGRENLPYDKDNRILEPKKKVIMKAWDLFKEDKISKDVLKFIIEKARSGKYADTPENRRLKRVGKEYGSKKQEETKEGDKGKKQGDNQSGDLAEQARNASVGELNDAIQHNKNEEVRQAAHAELARREKEEKPQEEKKFGEDYGKEKDTQSGIKGDKKDKNIPDNGKSEQPKKDVSADSETKSSKEDKKGASASERRKLYNYSFDNDNCEYYVRYSDHIDDDLKRGWSSWNFGQEGFEGTKTDLLSEIDEIKENGGGDFWLSGFNIWIDENEDISSDRSAIYIGGDKEIKQLYENYWVLVDNTNAEGGLSAHSLPSNLNNIGESLELISKEKGKYDGTGDGDVFKTNDAKVIYSNGNMHIIEVGENSNKMEKSGVEVLQGEDLEKEEKNLETDIEKLIKQWL